MTGPKHFEESLFRAKFEQSAGSLISRCRTPAEIPLEQYGVEYVCESTGVFLMVEKTQPHLKADAKKVVLPAFAEDNSRTMVMGVSQQTYKSSMLAVSCAVAPPMGWQLW